MSLFSKSRKIRIVVFEYPRVSSTTDRVDGFFDTLRQQQQNFQVLKRYKAVEPIGGKRTAQEFLKDFPQKGSVATDILDGKEVPKKIIIPTFPVTEKTVSQYSGWLGEMPPSFRKTWTDGKYFWHNKIHRYYGRAP